jgi:hypothetical protein
MDRLIDSLKVSRSSSSWAFYIFVFILSCSIIAATTTTYLFFRGVSIQQVQSRFPTLPINTILYVLAGTVVAVILLTLLGANFEFSVQRKNGGINRSMPPSQIFWKSGTPPQDPVNLMLNSDEFPMRTADIYTMGIDISIYDTRSNDKQGPFRHIVHRGTDDLTKFVVDSPGSVPKGRGHLNDGLPTQMNPGVFVDNFTNDIIVFIDTDPVTKGEAGFRESVRISDVPLKKPFQLHVTTHDQILEVYVNCRLAATKLLHGKPRAVPNDWYGRTGFARATAYIQNLTLWDSELYAFEIQKVCTPIIIPPNVAPTSCRV